MYYILYKNVNWSTLNRSEPVSLCIKHQMWFLHEHPDTFKSDIGCKWPFSCSVLMHHCREEIWCKSLNWTCIFILFLLQNVWEPKQNTLIKITAASTHWGGDITVFQPWSRRDEYWQSDAILRPNAYLNINNTLIHTLYANAVSYTDSLPFNILKHLFSKFNNKEIKDALNMHIYALNN